MLISKDILPYFDSSAIHGMLAKELLTREINSSINYMLSIPLIADIVSDKYTNIHFQFQVIHDDFKDIKLVFTLLPNQDNVKDELMLKILQYRLRDILNGIKFSSPRKKPLKSDLKLHPNMESILKSEKIKSIPFVKNNTVTVSVSCKYPLYDFLSYLLNPSSKYQQWHSYNSILNLCENSENFDFAFYLNLSELLTRIFRKTDMMGYYYTRFCIGDINYDLRCSLNGRICLTIDSSYSRLKQISSLLNCKISGNRKGCRCICMQLSPDANIDVITEVTNLMEKIYKI